MLVFGQRDDSLTIILLRQNESTFSIMAYKDIIYAAVIDNDDRSEPLLRKSKATGSPLCRYSLLLGLVTGLFMQLSTIGAMVLMIIMAASTPKVAPTISMPAYIGVSLIWSVLLAFMAFSVIIVVRKLLAQVTQDNDLISTTEDSFSLGCLISLSGTQLVALAALHDQHHKLLSWNFAFNALLLLTWVWSTWKVYQSMTKRHHEVSDVQQTQPLMIV
jgi:hypothetical protein